MQKAEMQTLDRIPTQQIDMLLKRIHANNSYPQTNKEAFDDIVSYLRSRGSKPNTLLKHIYCFEKYADAIGSVEMPTATKKDVERAFAKIESLNMAQETKRQVRVVVKAYYKHCYGNDEFFPEAVRWLKTTLKEQDQILPTDLISEDDILKLLDACKNKRDRAQLSLLFERGLRAAELLGMRKKDVNLLDNPPYIIVNVSKTKPRRIPIVFSAGYMADYMNQDKIKALSQNDFLWRDFEHNEPHEYDALRLNLKDITKRAGINKRVHLHLFRHSAASRMASEIPEGVLREIMGWSKKSNMTAKYVHLSGKTVDNALLKMDGMVVEEHETKLQTKQCPQCKFPNILGAYHCARCNALIEIKGINDILKNKELVKRVLAKAIKDESLFEEIYKEMK